MAVDMLRGSPARRIAAFWAPLVVGNLVQQAYTLVDAVVVGRQLGLEALAAVGSTFGLSFFVTGFVWGMSSGLAIPASQRFGADDQPGMRRAVVNGGVVCVGTALILTAIAIPLAPWVLRLMRTPSDIIAGATQFITVNILGLVVAGVAAYLGALMRALGDSRTPTVFWAASSVLNIGLVVLYVGPFGWGIAGAAWASVTAQALVAVASLLYIRLRLPLLRLHRADLVVTRADLAIHARLGWAMGFQASIISIGEIAVQRALNGLGTEAVAAATAGTRIGQFALGPLSCFGIAMSVFAGQNFGARHFARIRQGVRECLLLAAGYATLIGVFVATAGSWLARLSLGDGAEQAVSWAHTYLAISALGYVPLAALFVLRSALQGLGYTLAPTLAGVAELLARVLIASFAVGAWGFVGVSIAGPAAWVGSCIPLLLAWVPCRRQLLDEQRHDDALDPPERHRDAELRHDFRPGDRHRQGQRDDVLLPSQLRE